MLKLKSDSSGGGENRILNRHTETWRADSHTLMLLFTATHANQAGVSVESKSVFSLRAGIGEQQLSCTILR
jgi:hypothetical protein